jgi:hypothetical protein
MKDNERRWNGMNNERHYIYGGVEILVEVCLRMGKALESEKGKGLQCEFCYEQRRVFERRLSLIGIHFDIHVARTSLERNFDLTLGGLHQGEILILTLGGEGGMRNMQLNLGMLVPTQDLL